MTCPNCGTSNLDNATICANCGRPLTAAAVPPPPPQQTYTPPPPSFGAPPPLAPPPSNYLVQSILVTLCCCLPLGVVAIIFAAQVNTKFAAGDLAGAQEASRQAKMWCWIAFGLGLVAWLILCVIWGAAIVQALRQQGIGA
ncbi:MAG TPA: CD225/dispanin family protein [Thermoanaerobaculia bacterium]|nr:CD225/dispanin family protein [Thermoanaerobaculia bacterium]